MGCRSDYMAGSNDDEYIRQIDTLTELLCQLCDKLEKDGLVNKYLTGSVLGWWESHKLIDQKRKLEEEKESQRKQKIINAKNKLTREEKELLHIRD